MRIATDPATGAELVMPGTRAEYKALKNLHGPKPGTCCVTAGPVDHWPSFSCTVSSPGGRIFTHCTCRACF